MVMVIKSLGLRFHGFAAVQQWVRTVAATALADWALVVLSFFVSHLARSFLFLFLLAAPCSTGGLKLVLGSRLGVELCRGSSLDVMQWFGGSFDFIEAL
jgi:hypothetical protein